MAKTRSPEYPAIGLKEAIDRVKLVYEKDYQNQLPKKVIAEHMGYKGLSGTSLTVLAALSKYGLLEGRGDETRVSDLALAIIAHPTGAPERIEALRKAALSPELFSELDEKFPNGKASDSAIRSYLLTEKFIPEAADTAIRSYRETKQLVEAESVGYAPPEPKRREPPAMTPHVQPPAPKPGTTPPAGAPVTLGLFHESFNLEEGPVTLSFPVALSADSYQDFADRLAIILRQVKRRTETEQRAKEFARRENGDPDEAAN
jgi:hypothetical protein